VLSEPVARLKLPYMLFSRSCCIITQLRTASVRLELDRDSSKLFYTAQWLLQKSTRRSHSGHSCLELFPESSRDISNHYFPFFRFPVTRPPWRERNKALRGADGGVDIGDAPSVPSAAVEIDVHTYCASSRRCSCDWPSASRALLHGASRARCAESPSNEQRRRSETQGSGHLDTTDRDPSFRKSYTYAGCDDGGRGWG